jgi:hypothetical protein
MSLKWSRTKGDPPESMHPVKRGPAIPVYRSHPINTGKNYPDSSPRERMRRIRQAMEKAA